jgi:hypothetical protein
MGVLAYPDDAPTHGVAIIADEAPAASTTGVLAAQR